MHLQPVDKLALGCMLARASAGGALTLMGLQVLSPYMVRNLALLCVVIGGYVIHRYRLQKARAEP